jgi:predicted MFS family arabinose efflux permease
LLHLIDWRGLFLGLALMALLVAVAIFLWVPTHPHELRADKPSRPRDHLDGVIEVFTSALFWRVAPITVASQGSFLAIQSLWTGPWLRDMAQMTPSGIGTHLTLIAGAMVAGFLSMGWLSSRLALSGVPPMRTAIVGIVGFTLVQLVIIAGGEVSPWWWLLFGFLGTAGIIPYAALSQQFPAVLAGRVNTALNLLVFVAAFALQWGIGGIIDAWTSADRPGYAPVGYQFAFAAVWSLQICGLIWYFGAGKIKKIVSP